MTRVLLAEDDALWLDLIRRPLRRNGFEVLSVESSAGVLAHAAEADVLVIDSMLDDPFSDYTGIGAVGRLLGEGGIRPEVPIVFVSANSEHDRGVEGKLRELAIPKDRYVWLQKNFEEDYFIEVIRAELRKRAGSADG